MIHRKKIMVALVSLFVLMLLLATPAIPGLAGPVAVADQVVSTSTPMPPTKEWSNSGYFNWTYFGGTAHFGPLWFFIPENVVPENVPNPDACALRVQYGGGKANFSFDGALYTIRVICPTGVVQTLGAPLVICYSGDVSVSQRPWRGTGFVPKVAWSDASGRTCISITDF